MWVYRRLLKIPWTARITNTKVFQRTNQDRQLLAVVKQRMAYLGHIMSNNKYQHLQLILQEKIVQRGELEESSYHGFVISHLLSNCQRI